MTDDWLQDFMTGHWSTMWTTNRNQNCCSLMPKSCFLSTDSAVRYRYQFIEMNLKPTSCKDLPKLALEMFYTGLISSTVKMAKVKQHDSTPHAHPTTTA